MKNGGKNKRFAIPHGGGAKLVDIDGPRIINTYKTVSISVETLLPITAERCTDLGNSHILNLFAR